MLGYRGGERHGDLGEEGNKAHRLEQRLVNSEDWLGGRGEPWKK